MRVARCALVAIWIGPGCIVTGGDPSDARGEAGDARAPRNAPLPVEEPAPGAAPGDAPDAPPNDGPPPDAPPADGPPPDSPPPDAPPPPDEPAPPEPDEPIDNWGDGNTPATSGGSCVEWSDCAPHFDDPNSGIDCDNGTCRCDVTGEWAVLCAYIHGYWSPNDCFCFVGATTPPSGTPSPPEEADDDVACWWTWREWCEADRWVDTSYYERVCYGGDCYWEYVVDGYYEDGACTRRWIKRCTDGYDYWY